MILTAVVVRCDGCAQMHYAPPRHITNFTARHARTDAAVDAWTFCHGRDLCPACLEAAA